jgi:hypothetical protein
MRYIVVGLVWLALVVIALVGVAPPAARQPRTPELVTAARVLPRNHLVQSADLDSSGLGGRYVKDRIEVNKAVSPGDLASVPSLESDQVMLAKPIDRATVLQDEVNAGTDVLLCKADKEVGERLKVLAILCPADDGNCLALLAVPAERTKSIADALAADVKATPAARCDRAQ